jgi:flavodoxin
MRLRAMKSRAIALAAAALSAAIAAAAASAPARAQEPGSGGQGGEPPPYAAHFGKTLIIVYSLTGNTLDMAERIRALTGGDISRIETVETYPSGDQLIPYAKKQRDESRKPYLKSPLPDPGPYQTVFMGTPVWFHDLPPAVTAFLESMDFQGKALAPFITAGGGPGEAMDALRSSARNARVLDAKVITRYQSRPAEDIDREISLWLGALRDGVPADGVPAGAAPADGATAPRGADATGEAEIPVGRF